MSERGYLWVKSLKKQTGKNIPALLALTRPNDPFFCGSEADQKNAEWFAVMWEQKYEGQSGIHVRRVHYHLQAIEFPKLNGMPYRNTKADWQQLCDCSRAARLLGLVPADSFDDHRNADPYSLNWKYADGEREPSIVQMYSQSLWNLPSLSFHRNGRWTLEGPDVHGYDPDDYLDRAYYLEVWIEKSTMDDILVPLTRDLGIRLVPSSGYQSISNAVKLLKRVRQIQKPARIFYISDHDKAGRTMPVSVSRQVEFWLEEYAPDADIKLRALALTKAQIAKYKLPASPDTHAVELDSLEAIVPGELKKIVRQALDPYIESVDGELADTESEAQEIVEQKWVSLMEPYQRRLRTLSKSVEAVTKQYEKETASLNKRLKQDLAQFAKPLAKLQSDVSEASHDFNPGLPERPAQLESEQDEQDWLFDSSRTYLDQLGFYKAHSK